MNTVTEISVSLNPNNLDHLSKKELYQRTIETWDLLVDGGYSPADFTFGIVTMRYHGFKKLMSDHGNKAMIKETRSYRINTIWINDIEVSYTEIKSTSKDGWVLQENWKPLEIEQ